VLRTRLLATVGLCLIVATVTGVVLAFAAGAERTSTVADRYTSANGGDRDGVVYQNEGRPQTPAVAALPGAAHVDSITFVFGVVFAPGSTDGMNASALAGSYLATGSRLIAGRAPSPAAKGEFVASRSFIDATHAALGDKFDLKTFTQAQADANLFGSEPPAGPTVPAVLVGVLDGPANLDDPTPSLVFSPALLDDPQIGVKVTIMTVRFKPGVDLGTFRTQLDTLPDGGSMSLDKGVLVSPALRKAIDAQASGLWALAAVAAVAAAAALGQLITRHVRLTDAEQTRLSSIGYVDAQLVGESIGRAAVPVLSGAIVGVGVATGLSGLFPTGFVRRVEPDPGLRFESTVLLLGATAFFAALVLWISISLVLSRRTARGRDRAATAVETLAAMTGSATVSTGLRFAFARRENDRGSIRAIIVGLSLTIVGLVAALTFATSMARMVGQPARYGINYDVMIGSGGDTIPDDQRTALDADTDIGALTLYADGQARHGSATLRLVGMKQVKGDVGPPVLEGRLPVSDDEIALGRLTARSFHVGIGDQLELAGDSGSRQFHVAGLVVVPSIGVNEGIGQDAVITFGAMASIDPAASTGIAIAKFSGVTQRDGIVRLSQQLGLDPSIVGDPSQEDSRPAAIVNIARVRSIPFVLAALLTVLAVLTLGYVMVTSVQNRRRDVAILRSIGADRRWISRAVHWQATTFTLAPVIIGIPLGLIIGRMVFRLFADSIGTVNDASIPLLLMAGLAIGLAFVANAVAGLTARRSDHRTPAALLRSE
jgi:ABC-type lipoprotein release transport system permease subunit